MRYMFTDELWAAFEPLIRKAKRNRPRKGLFSLRSIDWQSRWLPPCLWPRAKRRPAQFSFNSMSGPQSLTPFRCRRAIRSRLAPSAFPILLSTWTIVAIVAIPELRRLLRTQVAPVQ